MKNTLLIFTLAVAGLVLFGCAGGPAPAENTEYRSVDEAVNGIMGEMSEKLPASKVAVVSIEAPNAEVSKSIIRTINVAITKTGKQRRIEREESRLAEIYAELDFQTSYAVDQKTAQSIGELLGVQIVIYGSYQEKEKGLFELYICAAGVETADVLWEDIKKSQGKKLSGKAAVRGSQKHKKEEVIIRRNR
ncbi:MAG: hypothetical protein LBG76_07460 [Treponema sp.]|jgi:hypothetical protein|nr:hypothetical protein [Treponema sp.]